MAGWWRAAVRSSPGAREGWEITSPDFVGPPPRAACRSTPCSCMGWCITHHDIVTPPPRAVCAGTQCPAMAQCLAPLSHTHPSAHMPAQFHDFLLLRD